MSLTASSDASAGAQFQSVAQSAGIDVSHLTAVAQLQLAVASLMTDTPPGSVAAGDIAAGTFGSNIPTTDPYIFPGTLAILGASLALSTAGAAFAIAGTTVASVADTASGAITIKANIGRGTGAVGGFIFQVPVTTSSGTTAQTLTTVLTLDATTVVRATFAGALAITGALSGVTSATFSTLVASSTALATPSALAATGFNAFASTVSGAVLMGFGTTYDVTLKNRAGTDVIGITANTTGVVLAGALRVNGAASLGTAAGTDITIIDGTAFGAGVASLRLNGLTTAAITNQTGTLLNAPSAGNPSFWMPISIAGAIRYVPCWT